MHFFTFYNQIHYVVIKVVRKVLMFVKCSEVDN